MKYRFILLQALLSLSVSCHAQYWEWVKAEGGDRQGGAIRVNQGTSICTDSSGNLYVAGYFSGQCIFGRDTLNSYINTYPLLMKYSPAGKAEWARQLTEGGTDYAYGACIDPDQNICVTGITSGHAINSFTCKYDSKGTKLWINESDIDEGRNDGKAIATDKKGNIYVAGDCSGTVSFDTFNIGAPSKYTIYLVKYDPKGKMIWLKHFNQSKCLAIDKDDNIYLAGEFTGALDLEKKHMVSKGASDVFIAKFSTGGKMQWLRSYGGKGNDLPRSIATDNKGNSFLTAYFSVPYVEKGKNIGGENLLEFNGNGDLAWNTQIGVADKDYLIGSVVATDNHGYLYLTGNTYGAIPLFGEPTGYSNGASDIFVAKCSPEGKKIWVTRSGGYEVDEGSAICVDKAGNIYATGYFHGKVYFDKHAIQSKSSDDGIFVGKLK